MDESSSSSLSARYGVLFLDELDSIEQAWSKLKTLLRSAAALAKEVLEEALAAGIDQITTADAQGRFAHAGYRLASI